MLVLPPSFLCQIPLSTSGFFEIKVVISPSSFYRYSILLGASKGLASISCVDSNVALTLMRLSGSIRVDGQPVLLELAPERKTDDWNCKYCSILNYHWRMQCFKCLVPRNASAGPVSTGLVEEKTSPPLLEGAADVSPVGTKFLLFQPLKDTTTAQMATISNAFANDFEVRFSDACYQSKRTFQ